MRNFFRRNIRPLNRASLAGGVGGAAFTAATVLGIALFVSIVGSFITYVNARAAFSRQVTLTHAQQMLDTLLREQLDEETALRGYLAAGQQRLYLQPYYDAGPRFDVALTTLQRSMQDEHLTEALPLLFDVQRNHELWERDIARPLITRPSSVDPIERQHRGKLLVDQIRLDCAQLSTLLETQSNAAADAVAKLLVRASTLTAALMLLFGTSAIVADIIRSHTQVALERERIVGDTLQRAFLSGWDVLPHLRIGTAYVSAARHAAVGGDLFDVHRIDDRRSLFVVADVSGKGLEAAVDTAFVKYSLRTLAEDIDDPAILLKKFNTAFLRAPRDDGAFISLFVGILDRLERSLRYASAGHAPAYLRRGDAVSQLEVTGPVIGLRTEDSFQSALLPLLADDTLILATDGLTEARDTAGIMLDDAGAIRIIREAPSDPQALADYVVAAITRLSGGRIADDLALLVVQLQPEAGQPVEPPIVVSAAHA